MAVFEWGSFEAAAASPCYQLPASCVGIGMAALRELLPLLPAFRSAGASTPSSPSIVWVRGSERNVSSCRCASSPPFSRKDRFKPNKSLVQDHGLSIEGVESRACDLVTDATPAADTDSALLAVGAGAEACSDSLMDVQVLDQKVLGGIQSRPEELFVEARISNALPQEMESTSLPGHVAIIMDGNSRWASRKGWPASVGHEMGVRALRKVIKLSCKWGIPALTVFAFSSENWRRPKIEIAFLMDLFERVLEQELINLIKEDIRVAVMGDLSLLPPSLRTLILRACDSTRANKGLKLTVALSYSGRQDIAQACRRLAIKVADGTLQASDITERVVEQELGTSWMEELRDPDLLIRTSGEQRLSNFMLWQIAYTELYFSNSLWPDFGEAEYAAAIESYRHRDRRFGRRTS